MKLATTVLLGFILLLTNLEGFAQTGPGGVGNSANNAFWIRADLGTSTTTNGSPVSSWQDVSGNGNDISQTTAVQQPLYTASLMNGYPAVLFDNNSTAGQNDYFSGLDDASLDNTNGLTIFTVVRQTNLAGAARSIIAKRTNVGVNQAYMFFFYTSDRIHTDIVSNDNRFSTPAPAFTTGTNYILNLHYDGTFAAGSRAKVYAGQTLLVTSTESAATIPDYNSPLIIGATHVGDNRAFGGYISEIILYREALGLSERILVDNYLSAKYDIAIASNNVYTMDTPANGNYDHDVAGIGRESATDLNTDGQGTGIVRVLNATGLDNNEYMMWGHDNDILQAINSTDIPAGVDARVERLWRTSMSNKAGAAVDVGAVDMQWDLSGLGAVTASDLRLLVDTDNDGIFADETPISGATDLGGGIYSFAGVGVLSDQRRFTIATINLIQTPLPVELVLFDAISDDNKTVNIFWQTKSEINSDFFEVEHSRDGSDWSVIAKEEGAGNSSVILDYKVVHETPNIGANYYRLKQVDLDGVVAYSVIRFVSISNLSFTLYPNPSYDSFTISNSAGGFAYLKVYNSMGQLVMFNDFEADSQQAKRTFNLEDFPAGIYFVETNFGTVRFTKL
ncbi:MAG: T9SS type A sorting domain-containing protein [Crocinitomicaceae bacterium]|nr:T9SS type A sorting domain-containing protein [Crocinitomicaceae bacterium]